MSGMRKQKFGTVAIIQVGLFLSATLAAVIGGAWTSLVQSNYNATNQIQLSLASTISDDEHRQRMMQRIQSSTANSSQKHLRYALIVTIVGLAVIIAWTLLVQEIDPNLVSSVEPVTSSA